MMPVINYDTLMNDPLLMSAAILLILGPLIFLVAFIQFLRAGRKVELPPIIGDESMPLNEMASPVPPPPPVEEPAPLEEEKIVTPPYVKEAVEEASVPPPSRRIQVIDPEKTVVMPSGLGEVQGQLEIAFSQIKTLNKKVAQLESELETVSKTAAAKLEKNDLSQAPTDPADFTQKLLKLAEHVIVLEKEVARMKSAPAPVKENAETETEMVQTAEAGASSGNRPPIMPI